MKPSNHNLIREYLRNRPTGAMSSVIADDLGLCASSIARTLKAMPDAYIRSWYRHPSNNHYYPVWDVAYVPPNAPKP